MRSLHERIDRNVARGRLSHRDARRLRDELDRIRDTEARMRRDGRLDERERMRLDRMLARLDREVSVARR